MLFCWLRNCKTARQPTWGIVTWLNAAYSHTVRIEKIMHVILGITQLKIKFAALPIKLLLNYNIYTTSRWHVPRVLNICLVVLTFWFLNNYSWCNAVDILNFCSVVSTFWTTYNRVNVLYNRAIEFIVMFLWPAVYKFSVSPKLAPFLECKPKQLHRWIPSDVIEHWWHRHFDEEWLVNHHRCTRYTWSTWILEWVLLYFRWTTEPLSLTGVNENGKSGFAESTFPRLSYSETSSNT